MKKNLLWLLIISLIVISVGCSDKTGLEKAPEKEPTVKDSRLADHIPRQVMIKLKPEADKQRVSNQVGGEIIDVLDELNAIQVKLPKGKSVAEVAEKLGGRSDVKFAHPNYKYHTCAAPNDKLYQRGEQWALEKIKAKSAWEKTTGSQDVVIAVLDTGVDIDHKELKDKVLAEDAYNSVSEGSKVTDKVGHGTHVSGIAAGKSDNKIGVAGVAWQTQILPVKVLNNYGKGSDATIIDGILHVTDWVKNHSEKRVIINMSLGGRGYSRLMQKAINRAIEKGIVVVASMGNNSKSVYHYPAAYQGVIAVGATNVDDEKASSSTTGEWISVSAPGKDILSTLPNNSYGRWNGTSMAAPHVAGAAALILSKSSDLSPAAVKAQLEQTADDLGPSGFDDQFGYGRINLKQAVSESSYDAKYGQVKVKVNNTTEKAAGINLLLYNQSGEFITSTVTSVEQDKKGGIGIFRSIPPGKYYIVASVKNKEVVTSNQFEVKKEQQKEVKLTINADTGDQGYIKLKWEDKVNLDLAIEEPNGVTYVNQGRKFDTVNGQFSKDVKNGGVEGYKLDRFHESGVYTVKIYAYQPAEEVTVTKNLGEPKVIFKGEIPETGVYKLKSDKGSISVESTTKPIIREQVNTKLQRIDNLPDEGE